MKRYLLFAGEDYYPRGGWRDFIGSGSDVERLRHRRPVSDCEWAQIVDSCTGKIVLVWDEYPNIWGTPDEVQAASDAKLAARRKSGAGPIMASMGGVYFAPTSAEWKP